MNARLWCRPKVYRGREGWHIYGTDTLGRRVSIFVEHRTAVERVKAAIKRGNGVTLADLQAHE